MVEKKKHLTKAQTEMMNKHKQHHTKAHLASMRMHMLNGKSFKQAHELAMKKYGK